MFPWPCSSACKTPMMPSRGRLWAVPFPAFPLCLSALSATILSVLQGCLFPAGNVLLGFTVQGRLLALNPWMVSLGTSALWALTAVGIQH